jgi:hypothetical protein
LEDVNCGDAEARGPKHQLLHRIPGKLLVLSKVPRNPPKPPQIQSPLPHQIARARRSIALHNHNPRPFTWTKSADEIFETMYAMCKDIAESRH